MTAESQFGAVVRVLTHKGTPVDSTAQQVASMATVSIVTAYG